MRRAFTPAAAIVLLCLGGIAQADVFNLGTGLTSLETVAVGDPGNPADTRYERPGYGAVACAYHIGKYEVTAGQYTEFLNAVAKTDTHELWRGYMWEAASRGCMIKQTGSSGSYTYTVATDRANRPVNFVSFWNACRFANWLHNGQPTGEQNASTTEDGAYDLNSHNGTDGSNITRNAGGMWFIPSVDEWYKAAYYKGGGTDAGYWDYPTQSDSTPSNDLVNPDPGNNANFGNGINDLTIGSPYWRTNVGEFENSESAYGTFDQGGNVWEWTDTVGRSGGRLGIGGSFSGSDPAYNMHAECTPGAGPDANTVSDHFGFRLAYFPGGWQPVPEPSSLLVLACGLAGIGGLVRRVRR